MLNGWRLKLRQAEHAFQQGLLEEAAQLLNADEVQAFLPARQLQRHVATALAQRALSQQTGGDQVGGWRSLDLAKELGGPSPEWGAARQAFVNRIFEDMEGRLLVVDAAGALQLVEELEKHGVEGRSLRTFKEAARRIQSARKLAARGQFGEADQQLAEVAVMLHPHSSGIEQEREATRQRGRAFREQSERLHRLLQERRWSEVVAAADEILTLAPDYKVAQDARRQAWKEVQQVSGRPTGLAATHAQVVALPADRVQPPLPADGRPAANMRRWLLWVDAVGGYLVCPNDEVTLGQALPLNSVDIPIQADISRRHAKIRRQGGAYVLDPLHAVCVDGKPTTEKTLLSDGDEIELGSAVRLRFRQPHALSATARLEFISPHRTQPACDAVLLFAESCILGPRHRNHVFCRDWSSDVVIFRQDEQLYCRATEPLEIDGEIVSGRGRLRPHSRICGSDFSMTLEELDKCTK